MQHSKVCCTLPPIVSDYKPTGKHITLSSGMDAYTVGLGNVAIVVIYDIFGYWPTTYQSVDLLAHATGARLIMPDFFKGKPWPLSNFPPSNQSELSDWIGKQGDFHTNVEQQLLAAINEATSSGAQKFGLVGMCWGAKMCTMAASIMPNIGAIALVHPAFLSLDLFKSVKCPTCILPSKDEPEMHDIKEHCFAANRLSVFQRFDDMYHGWCAARADFSNDLNRQRTHEALTLIAEFFVNAL